MSERIERLTTAGEVVGASSIAAGFALIWAPLGLIAGGILLIGGCVLASVDSQ